MIKTKSLYDNIEDDDGTRIVITRYWPRGKKRKPPFCDIWLPDAGPDATTLRRYKSGDINWEQYTTQYIAAMEKRPAVVVKLAKMAMKKTITLLCFEPESNPCCHRHLLKKLIEGCRVGLSTSK